MGTCLTIVTASNLKSKLFLKEKPDIRNNWLIKNDSKQKFQKTWNIDISKLGNVQVGKVLPLLVFAKRNFYENIVGMSVVWYLCELLMVWKILYTIFWQTNTGKVIAVLQNRKNKIKLQMRTGANGVLNV
jgi:hypothetical protein